VNIHRLNKTNVGDYYCAPHHYFEELKGKALDISDLRSRKKSITNNFINEVSEKSLIIGGGGLMNIKYFRTQMKLFEALAKRGKKIVIWGAGHNEIDYDEYLKKQSYRIDLKPIGIAGTRDYGNTQKDEWIPCVSCLNPIFDQTFKIKQEVGLLFNHKSIKDNGLKAKYSDYPISSNTSSLEEMVDFIGASETVVTNSYHAMYWAILMKRRVIAIPTTSKFFDFKYKVPISTFDNFKNELMNTTIYDGVLQECREINLQFSQKVFEYLNL
jgi:polysaccharide pyruvyl transferase WcaK-like protein